MESRNYEAEGGLGFSRMNGLFGTQRNLRECLLDMQQSLHECFYCFYLFLRMYAYLGGGECDVTAASHVLVMSHVTAVGTAIGAAIGTAIGTAIGVGHWHGHWYGHWHGWHWQCCHWQRQRWLASQVTWKSIYSTVALIGNGVCF